MKMAANNNVEKMWTETLVAEIKILTDICLLRVRKITKSSVMTDGALIEIPLSHFLNLSQKCNSELISTASVPYKDHFYLSIRIYINQQ
jgi:hypothetical protein